MSAAAVAAVTVALVGAAVPALAADGSVAGLVFRDFNSDGAYSTGNTVESHIPNDVPLAGVTATAFDRSGAQVGRAVSAADGKYLIQVAGAQTADLRIEFTFSAAQKAEGYESSYHGATGGSSVQFAQLGVTGIDFGANVPEDYSKGAVKAVIAVDRNGDPLMTGYPDSSSVVGIDWNQKGIDTANLTVLSTVNGAATFGVATGSLYGLAAPRGSNIVYGSAVLRRHVGLGAAGLGGIYAINQETTEAELFLDLGTVAGIDVGEAALTAALTGAGATENAKRGLAALGAPNLDAYAFEQVGKTGLGGMAVSSDGKTLYVINLHERNLLSIDIATKAVTEVSLGTLAADERPFAVTVNRGKIYVGVVRTGEISKSNSDVAMRVIATPETAIGSWTDAIGSFPLTFTRGDPFIGQSNWQAWRNQWPAAVFLFWVQDPQPILSSITFDTNGNMVLGFLDRFSLQAGGRNNDPSGGGPFSAFSNGGLYGASPDGDGTYTMESGGILAGVTGYQQTVGGPGGGLFYDNESSLDPNVAIGAVAAVPGLSTILATVYDSTALETSDIDWVPTNGTAALPAQRVLDETSFFSKAGGLGGVAVVRALAPVEIGDRTWYDADFDGVQDPDEPVLPGVTVRLTDAQGNPVLDAAGNPVAPVTTDVRGNFYFSNLVANKDYIVHFDGSTADVSGLTAKFGITSGTDLGLTEKETEDSRTVDSNADPDTGEALVSVGDAGQNDHTVDAGFVALRYMDITKTVTGDAPADAEFTIELTCTDFTGEELDPIEETVSDGDVLLVDVPAGTTCTVEEIEDGGAIRATYSTNGAAASQSSPTILVKGSLASPDQIEVVNEFPSLPTAASLPKPPVATSPLSAILAATGSAVLATGSAVLAMTGATLWMLIAPVAAGLLIAGAVLMLLRRRRRADTN